MVAAKKTKKAQESINSRLALVMKSGKYTLGYKTTLKTLRSGKVRWAAGIGTCHASWCCISAGCIRLCMLQRTAQRSFAWLLASVSPAAALGSHGNPERPPPVVLPCRPSW